MAVRQGPKFHLRILYELHITEKKTELRQFGRFDSESITSTFSHSSSGQCNQESNGRFAIHLTDIQMRFAYHFFYMWHRYSEHYQSKLVIPG